MTEEKDPRPLSELLQEMTRRLAEAMSEDLADEEEE